MNKLLSMIILFTGFCYASDEMILRPETYEEGKCRLENIERIRTSNINIFSQSQEEAIGSHPTKAMKRVMAFELNKFARELDVKYKEEGFYDYNKSIYSYCPELSNIFGEHNYG